MAPIFLEASNNNNNNYCYYNVIISNGVCKEKIFLNKLTYILKNSIMNLK